MQTPIGEINTQGQLALVSTLTADYLSNQPFSALSEKLPSMIVVDGSTVTNCDSAGVAALIWLLQQAEKQQAKIIWQNLPIIVTRLLSLYDLNNKELIFYAGTTH
ncbi:STAS domain-containing protein [Suttonella ornithocola]|uniref:Predicted NTP binding protein (Contains STAS domain) n=1 Tax=Suttonella ornithocola TaxID=279832 RepID=A0A380MVJ8_9GAMM|nr:STAS domain-containing protein [Suttonella ornithocola]SUO96599.1 Predicted NTP binding protein (contains STAS domain) [Suttonella ornithocola]